MFHSAGLTLLTLAAAGDALADFVLNVPGALTVSRMDPIADPGEIAGHVHRVVGASNFNANLRSPEEMLKAACTTTQVSADKSNYWVPSLYWINPNGTYSYMPHVTKIYYFINNEKQKVHPFPQGLRMITGLAKRRDPGHAAAQGITINLDPYNADQANYNHQYLPNGTVYPAPKGDFIHMNIRFPTCGLASQDLDSDDHFSHMSWPIDEGSGEFSPTGQKCPESHPIMYPQIFMENFYYMTKEQKATYDRNGPNFILSNGDVTGVTFHADFINGWERDVLQGVIDGCGNVGAELANCPAVRDRLQNGQEDECRYSGQIPAEDIGIKEPLKYLPGCNPRWNWDGPKDKPNECPWYKKPGWTSPNLQWSGPVISHGNFPVVIPGLSNDADSATGLGVPQGGIESEGDKPIYLPWASQTYYKDRSKRVPGVMVGTQAQVNADVVANAGNSECKDFNGPVSNFASKAAGSGAIPNPDTAGSGGTFKQTYKCQEPQMLPCGPPEGTTVAGASEQAAQKRRHDKRSLRRRLRHH